MLCKMALSAHLDIAPFYTANMQWSMQSQCLHKSLKSVCLINLSLKLKSTGMILSIRLEILMWD